MDQTQLVPGTPEFRAIFGDFGHNPNALPGQGVNAPPQQPGLMDMATPNPRPGFKGPLPFDPRPRARGQSGPTIEGLQAPNFMELAARNADPNVPNRENEMEFAWRKAMGFNPTQVPGQSQPYTLSNDQLFGYMNMMGLDPSIAGATQPSQEPQDPYYWKSPGTL